MWTCWIKCFVGIEFVILHLPLMNAATRKSQVTLYNQHLSGLKWFYRRKFEKNHAVYFAPQNHFQHDSLFMCFKTVFCRSLGSFVPHGLLSTIITNHATKCHIIRRNSYGNIFRVIDEENPPVTSNVELWIFSLICAWTNGWANNRDAGDLRRHGAHYDVITMYPFYRREAVRWLWYTENTVDGAQGWF